MSYTLDNARGNNPNDNDLDAVFDAMAKEYPQPDIPLQPITPRHDNATSPINQDSGTPQNAQDNAEATSEQPYQASNETPPDATCVADAASNESGTPSTRNDELDLSWVDHPGSDPTIGLFTVKAANQWIDEASNRPMPCKLFGQLWYEHEICILFSSSNLGKSILAVQIADAISRGDNALGLVNEAQAQKVLYFDFELSDKQFEGRYMNETNGKHYEFSNNLIRIEINPDVVDYPDGCDFEEYIKISMQQVVEETDARVIILDNITYLSRETEKAKDALPLMQWLKAFGKKFGLSILVLAHTPKRNTSNPITKNDCFGSSMLQNFCDGMFAIGESSRGTELRYIKELKQRNVPFAYDADNVIVCEIAKPDNYLMFRFNGYGCESEHLRQITADDREALIERAKELSAQGKSQRDIAKELGVSPGTVNNYLKK